MRIRHIFISPGHNFVGHHGKPPSGHATLDVREARLLAGRGIEGDRYLDFKDDYKGQITFFGSEVFWEVCELLGVKDKTPGAARRNVVTSGIDLNTLIGRKFKMQGIEFEGVCECKPCYWMDSAIGPGAEAALRGRGGLRAKILNDGNLRVPE